MLRFVLFKIKYKRTYPIYKVIVRTHFFQVLSIAYLSIQAEVYSALTAHKAINKRRDNTLLTGNN